LRLHVVGKTKEDLFLNALRGMASVMKASTGHEPAGSDVEVRSPDSSALLVDFLNEVIYLSNVNKAVYNEVFFRSLSDTSLSAKLEGFSVDKFDEDIKAATHHEADIKTRPDGYLEVTLVFDI
jgi:SHS2 domain-containing protein